MASATFDNNRPAMQALEELLETQIQISQQIESHQETQRNISKQLETTQQTMLDLARMQMEMQGEITNIKEDYTTVQHEQQQHINSIKIEIKYLRSKIRDQQEGTSTQTTVESLRADTVTKRSETPYFLRPRVAARKDCPVCQKNLSAGYLNEHIWKQH